MQKTQKISKKNTIFTKKSNYCCRFYRFHENINDSGRNMCIFEWKSHVKKFS